MASRLQTSCRASCWTIGVCILAAALLPGEPVPGGFGGLRGLWGAPGGLGGSGGFAGCPWGSRAAGERRERWARRFGVCSRCGSLCARLGRAGAGLSAGNNTPVCFGSSCRQRPRSPASPGRLLVFWMERRLARRGGSQASPKAAPGWARSADVPGGGMEALGSPASPKSPRHTLPTGSRQGWSRSRLSALPFAACELGGCQMAPYSCLWFRSIARVPIRLWSGGDGQGCASGARWSLAGGGRVSRCPLPGPGPAPGSPPAPGAGP